MLRGRIVGMVWLALACACSQAVPAGAPGASRLVELPLAAAPPLYLEVWARVRGSRSGPLEPDMQVRAGDRIQLTARTSCDAQVLLLYCDHEGQLSVYPERGALPFRGDQRVQLPAAGMDIQLGPEPGRESLYVLASRPALAQADPPLYAALTGAAFPRCGPALQALLAGPAPMPASAAPRAALRGVDVSDDLRSVARAFAAEDGVVVLGFAFEHLR